EARLDQLQIPVAVLAPEEVIDHMGRFVESVGLQSFVDLLGHAIEAREDPAVVQCLCLKTKNALRGEIGSKPTLRFAEGWGTRLEVSQRPQSRLLRPVHVHEQEAGGVPNLVGEGAIALRTALGKRNVRS